MVLENVDRQSRKGRRNPNHTQARRSGVYVQMGIKKKHPTAMIEIEDRTFVGRKEYQVTENKVRVSIASQDLVRENKVELNKG